MALDHVKNNPFWQKKFHQAVLHTDVDQDGFISRADFDLIVQRSRETGASEAHAKKHQESFDKLLEIWGMTDPSVQFTLKEFEDKFRETLEKNFAYADKLYGEWFDQVDLNENGEISLDEWTKHSQALNVSSEDANKSYIAMDTNKDGIISREEFIEYHKEFFFSADDKLHSSILYGPLD